MVTSDLYDRPRMGRCYHSRACPDLPEPARAQPLEICITSFHLIAFIRSRDALLCKSTKPYYFFFYRMPAFCNASSYPNPFSSMGYPSTRLRYLAFCECPHASIRIVTLRPYLGYARLCRLREVAQGYARLCCLPRLREVMQFCRVICLYLMPRAYKYCDNDKRPRCSVLNIFCYTWRKRR